MNGALKYIEEVYAKRTTAWCVVVALIVLLVDYLSGKAIRFPILYILPAGMAAWRNKKTLAYLIAIFLPLMRIVFHFLWHETQSLYLAHVNALLIVSALIFYVYLIDRTADQTRQLQKKVKVLEGILPICAACKKIRNDAGDYEQLEDYVTRHSEASFSHGLCSECARKLYPDHVKN
ncbi:MAG: hypothetical protein WAM73_17925 [Desulfobacterales bacterium]